MCGIVGYAGRAQAAPILLEGLRRLEYRGYDSAGMAVREEMQRHIEVIKAKGRLENLSAMTDDGHAILGTSGVGHTRWATHGEPSARNAHPHYSREKRVVLVHNGIIENHREIREMLLHRGYSFHTQTDTEAAALLLDDYYAQEETGTPEERALRAIRAMMMRLSGSYALGILFYDQPGAVYAVRCDSPLVVGRCEGETPGHILASDVPALLSYTRDVIYLDDMQIVHMTKDALCIYDMDGEAIERPFVRIDWDARAAEKGGYAHFMLKEMYEQPAAVRETLLPRMKKTQSGFDIDLSEAGMSPEDWQAISRVCFVGCGSAYHAGMVGRCVTQELAQIPCECELASELRYRNAPTEEGVLCVVVSQSGETADSLAALRVLKKRGVRTLAIVNVVGSSIAREADAVLYTHAGPEISVATTKAYSAQLALLYLLAVHIAALRGKIDEGRKQALLLQLESLDKAIGQMLGQTQHMERLAAEYCARRNVFFIGRGIDYALCMEGSLKLKEISYIHSQAYAAGELKHGAISLIEKGVLVIAAATQPALYAKMLSAMAETQSRGADILMLTMQEGDDAQGTANDIVRLPLTEPLFAASAAIVAMQLFAYFVACERGTDVDKPRNLAKSVTVE